MRVINLLTGRLAQRLHAVVDTVQTPLKGNRVGDDGTGHAAGLGNVAQSQQTGNGRRDVGAQFSHFIQDGNGSVNCSLQSQG